MVIQAFGSQNVASNNVFITVQFQEISQGRSDLSATERLKGSLIAPYQWLFLQMGRLEGGVKFLVDLRSDLLVGRNPID